MRHGRRATPRTRGVPRAAAVAATAGTLLVAALAWGCGSAPGEPARSASDAPDVRVADVRCSVVTYTAPAAAPQAGDLCVPVSAGGAPVRARDVGLVLIHGGGGTQGRREDLRAWAERYGREGYVTLNVDYYLTPEDRVADPRQPTYPRPERDVKAAVQYLRRRAGALGIGADRIVAQGHSAGARLGGQLLTTPDDPYFAGPERWDGTSDRADGFVGFYGAYNGANQDAARYYGGERTDPDPAVQARWAKANSAEQATRATGPALLFHGDADATAPLRQSVEFDAALRAAGVASRLVVVPGAPHGFDRERSAGRLALTPQGEQAARTVLGWLEASFPARR
jgi:acetyl esterase/lipase